MIQHELLSMLSAFPERTLVMATTIEPGPEVELIRCSNQTCGKDLWRKVTSRKTGRGTGKPAWKKILSCYMYDGKYFCLTCMRELHGLSPGSSEPYKIVFSMGSAG